MESSESHCDPLDELLPMADTDLPKKKTKLHVLFQSPMYLAYDRILDPIESKFRTPQKASDGLAHCFFVHTSLPRTLAQLPSSTLEFTN